MSRLLLIVVVLACLVPGGRGWCSPDAGRHVGTVLLGYDADSYFVLETTIDNPGSYYKLRETLSWIHWSNDGRKLAERVIADVEYSDTTANRTWKRQVIAADTVASSWRLCPPNMHFAGLTQPNPALDETLTVGPEGLGLRRWGGIALLASRAEIYQFSPLVRGRVCNGLTESSEVVITGTVRGKDVTYILARAGDPCCLDTDAAEFIVPMSATKMTAARDFLFKKWSGGQPSAIPRSWVKSP